MIESYSRSAAIELGQYRITVNAVAPGPIQTGYLILVLTGPLAFLTAMQQAAKGVEPFRRHRYGRWTPPHDRC